MSERDWGPGDVGEGTDMDDLDIPPIAEREEPYHVWYADVYGETRQDFLRDEHTTEEET